MTIININQYHKEVAHEKFLFDNTKNGISFTKHDKQNVLDAFRESGGVSDEAKPNMLSDDQKNRLDLFCGFGTMRVGPKYTSQK